MTAKTARHPASVAARALRKAMGKSQTMFAVQELGMAVSTVARYETTDPPCGDMLLRFASLAGRHGHFGIQATFRRLYMNEVSEKLGLIAGEPMTTTDPELKPAVRLAKIAIVLEQAHAVYFPASAHEMAELASEVMEAEGVRFWVSPTGDAITCTKCRMTSYNPNDVANHYCGNCRVFL